MGKNNNIPLDILVFHLTILYPISADIKAAVSSMVAIGDVLSTRMYSPKVLSLSAATSAL
jgi:hypothetical protein